MTGGAVEVRMTELIGSRTYDTDGDGVVDRAAAADSLKNGLTVLSGGGKHQLYLMGLNLLNLR